MNANTSLSLLIQNIKQGDEQAFESFFHSYCEQLIAFANRYLNDIPVAENIVQDVFVDIWINRAKLDPSRNMKTYLYTAVKNQALKQLRHQDVKRKYEMYVSQENLTIKTPEEQWQQKEIEQQVKNAIQQLPPKCRLIFSMNRFDNLTYAEIADIQGISVKTVETQMGRALKFLRKRLSHLLTSMLLSLH